MLTQQINPPPTNEQSYFQPQPQFSVQPQPQSILPPNAFQYTQSIQLRPLPTQVQQSLQSVQNQNQAQFAIGSSINRSGFTSVRGSKYNNKYSFKRHGAINRSKLMSTSVNQVEVSGMRTSQESLVNEVNYWRSMAQQQENALIRIREFAFNRRRGIVESSSLGLESIRHANSLSQVYNLSLVDGNIQPLEFIAETQQVIQNGGNVSTITTKQQTRQQEVVVNYELANQRSNSHLVNSNININNNNRPVVYIQQASQSVRHPGVDQTVQQFQFQDNTYKTSFVPTPAPVTVASTPPTVTAQRSNLTTQFVQVSQISQTIREPIKESPRPQSTINPETSKPQPSKNDFSIPSYTPYQQSYKPYEVPTYKSNETTTYTPYQAPYKQYEAPAYTSNETTGYTQKPQSFYFTRDVEHYSLPTQNSNNNAININTNSDLYTLEIRELRNKVQALEQQKSALIDKIRLIQKTNFSSNNSQETIQVYRDEINQLKIQIAELTDLYNSGSGRQHNDTQVSELRKSILILTETNKQYEEQLIQAQNHIIYLENSRNADQNTLHLEDQVKYLRETIAKYTQHVQQLDIERQKYHELLQQRENEIQNYLHEVNESRSYIESLEGHIEKTKHAVEGNGVSYDNYNQLVAEYGKKQLQVIILMEEINRLNYRYNELQAHLEKAEEYIIHIQETNNGNVGGVTTNELALLREQYEAELARAAEENNTLNQTIHRLQTSIEQSSIIEKTAKVSSSQLNVNNDQYNRLLQEIAKREEETRLLSQEMAVLNSKYAETKDHLEKAEDYIIHLQEAQQANSPVNALVAPDTDRLRLEEELNQLQIKIRQYQTELLQEKRERETLQHRSDLFSAEYEDMESRYKNALESLSKRYDQLLQERNSITARLSQAQDKLISEASTANREDISHINSSMQDLDAQLKETREHLKRAQEYIEGNMRVWQEASGYKERHDKQLAFIQLLHQDLDNTKRQNQELAGKLEHFDHLVGQIERLRSDNEKLIIVVHSKDNAGISTSLKQIDQVQESLVNYTRLYQESQARVATLRTELENLNHQLLAKQAQLDQTVHQSLQTQDHLRKAQEHIVYMQQQLTTSQNLIQQLDAALRAETAKSGELHEALKHAQDHIYHIQQQIKGK